MESERCILFEMTSKIHHLSFTISPTFFRSTYEIMCGNTKRHPKRNENVLILANFLAKWQFPMQPAKNLLEWQHSIWLEKNSFHLDTYLKWFWRLTYSLSQPRVFNWPISQIPQCINWISQNAQVCNRNVHTHAHSFYEMVDWGIWVDIMAVAAVAPSVTRASAGMGLTI